jgi:hypothetical protein
MPDAALPGQGDLDRDPRHWPPHQHGDEVAFWRRLEERGGDAEPTPAFSRTAG